MERGALNRDTEHGRPAPARDSLELGVDPSDEAEDRDPVGAALGVERRDERRDQDPRPAPDHDPPRIGPRSTCRIEIGAQGDPQLGGTGRFGRRCRRTQAPGGPEPVLPGRRREATGDAVGGHRPGPEVEPRRPGGSRPRRRRRRPRHDAVGGIGGDRRPGPDPADEVALGGELLVGGRDRDPGDAQVGGEGSDPGQPVAGPEAPGMDRRPELVLDLPVQRGIARPIEQDRHGRRHDSG